VQAEATHIPEAVTVSIAGLAAGDSLYARDIKLPAGTTLDVDPGDVVIQVLSAQGDSGEAGDDSAEG
jgi:large subunit ribosomal protein L25